VSSWKSTDLSSASRLFGTAQHLFAYKHRRSCKNKLRPVSIYLRALSANACTFGEILAKAFFCRLTTQEYIKTLCTPLPSCGKESRRAQAARLLVLCVSLCAFTTSALSNSAKHQSLAILLRLTNYPPTAPARRTGFVVRSVGLVGGLSSPLLCAPAWRPAYLLHQWFNICRSGAP
jgi:hypothetical protein